MIDGRCIKLTYPRAKRDYTCYGCGGECPVPKDEWYLRVTIANKGKLESHHYCQRCAYALENKLKHRKENIASIEQGGLRWTKLNAEFRKHWTDLIHNLNACKTDDEMLIAEKVFLKWLRPENTTEAK
jgi:hypothetical protein